MEAVSGKTGEMNVAEHKRSDPGSLRAYYETKIKDQQELIARQNKRLSILAHDLRGPLSLIINALDIYESVTEAAERKVIRDRLRSRSKQMLSTLNELISNTKLDSGAVRIERHRVDVRQTISEILADYRMCAGLKNITLKAVLPECPVNLLTDTVRFSEIVENLVDNAIKYSRGGGSVTVALSETREYTELMVADNGIGIRAEELRYLFDEFSGVSNRPTAGEPSSGLGLSIVKKLTRLLGGQIFVESSPDRGSTFLVKFPKEQKN